MHSESTSDFGRLDVNEFYTTGMDCFSSEAETVVLFLQVNKLSVIRTMPRLRFAREV